MAAPPRDDEPSDLRRSRFRKAAGLARAQPPPAPPPASLPEIEIGGEAAPEPEQPLEAAESSGRLYLAGDIIAQKYRLTRLLGEGGMGAVWLARNLKLDVDVAIKLIRHELATAETSGRLLQEARAAARIGHRSIVRIFDFGETELDDPFIVMEVLTGESLRDVLERKGRLPATNAVGTLLPIASALVEAHASGIVHRDLKPENIMLVPDTSGGVLPKLVDFGIAKLRRADETGEPESRDRIVVGTPEYMSPEQAGGRDEVDESADVWALAVILYEAITGRVPFAGPNYSALIFAIMTEEPTPSSEQLAGDAKLWSILQEGLAKRSDARPRMSDFGRALAEWAIARGMESDIAGASLAAHWINRTTRSPFSMVPPPASDEDMDGVDLVIPKAAPTGSRVGDRLAPTVAPPSVTADQADVEPRRPPPRPESRRRRTVALAVAVLVAAAIPVLAMSRRTAPTPRSALPPAATASTPLGPGSAAPLPTETASASASISAETPATSAVPPAASAGHGAVAHPGARPWPPKQVRKGRLPIAKQPNF